MIDKITPEQVRESLAPFESELGEQQLSVIVQSISSEAALDKLVNSIKAKLRAELVQQVRYTLSRLARAGYANIEFWGWMLATLHGSRPMPVTNRARVLSRITSIALQDAALEAIQYDQYVDDLRITPIEVKGSYRLEATGRSASRFQNGALCYLRPNQMYFNNFWIALCQQIIADKNRTAAPVVYRRCAREHGTDQRWLFEGNAEQWMSLLQHLLVHPAEGDTPEFQKLILGDPQG